MVVASAVLSVDTSAHSTVMGTAPVVGFPSLLVVAEAVLTTVPFGHGAVAAVVGLVMWTWLEAPGTRSVPGPPKLSVVPMMFQPGEELAPSIVQTRPGLVGSGSDTVTSWAVPVPLLATFRM